jgi:hypothetical protein
MRFKLSESTAARRTWVFHATLSASGADATGLTPVLTLSKAGAAFAACDAGTAITELTNGWYKIVHAAADLDTLGALGCRIAVATMDTLCIVHTVVAIDQYDSVREGLTALPNATAGSTSGLPVKSSLDTVASDVTAIEVKALPTTWTTKSLGTLTTSARTSTAQALGSTIESTVVLGGSFSGSASVQVKVSDDGGSSYSNYGSALTSAGTVTVTEAHDFVEAVVSSGDGSTAVTVQVSMHVHAP